MVDPLLSTPIHLPARPVGNSSKVNPLALLSSPISANTKTKQQKKKIFATKTKKTTNLKSACHNNIMRSSLVQNIQMNPKDSNINGTRNAHKQNATQTNLNANREIGEGAIFEDSPQMPAANVHAQTARIETNVFHTQCERKENSSQNRIPPHG